MNLVKTPFVYFLLILIFSIPTVSYGLTVNNNNDSGPGSLRDAIANTPPGGTVDFAVIGTIVLTSEIALDKTLTIQGPGANLLTVSGGNSTRIFHITGDDSMTIIISGLTLANAFINSGDGGGAIRLVGPNLELDNCVFDSNAATCTGIDCDATGAALDSRGGGANIKINKCSFISNTGDCLGVGCDASGTGISNGGGGVTIEINNSTFASNSSNCLGVECNASGAGIYNGGGGVTIEVNFSTFASNSSNCQGVDCFQDGSSLHIGGGSSGLIISNSIFSTDSEEGNCSDIEDIVSLGYNIDNGVTCITGAVIGDKPNTIPGLDPAGAQDNGGPTPTIALLPNSVAIDMADPSCPPPDTDQRGVLRPQLIRCDIGAYEFQNEPSNVPTLSEWGLIAMVSILGIIGFMVIRRRNAAA